MDRLTGDRAKPDFFGVEDVMMACVRNGGVNGCCSSLTAPSIANRKRVEKMDDISLSCMREKFDVQWDSGQLACGELLLKLRKKLLNMPGKVMKLSVQDPGAVTDVPAFCRLTGHRLLNLNPASGEFWIRAKD